MVLDKNQCDALEYQLALLETKELNLADALGSGIMREEIYRIKIREVENKRVELKHQLKEIQTKSGIPVATFEQIKNVFIDGNISSNEYLRVGEQEKCSMLEKLLSNAMVKDKNIVRYQFKSIFQVLANAPKNGDLQTLLGN